MLSAWNESDAARCADELELRAYSSRLAGRDPGLVLLGGGSTSLKMSAASPGGTETLYIIGDSGSERRRDTSLVRQRCHAAGVTLIMMHARVTSCEIVERLTAPLA